MPSYAMEGVCRNSVYLSVARLVLYKIVSAEYAAKFARLYFGSG